MDDANGDLERWACRQGMHVPASVAARWTQRQYEAWCQAWPMGVVVVSTDNRDDWPFGGIN